jgi:pyruvoyl-dependent arginine decarboxylase (PvlArgDC)
MSNKKQTAVEWLIENSHIIPKNELNKREVINQAKEMEKEQIKDAYETSHISMMTSEQYYKETFNTKEK